VPFALLLLGAMISAFQHTQIDYRIVEYLNSFAGRSQLLDRTMHAVTTLVLLQGAVFISLIWYLWFACPDHCCPAYCAYVGWICLKHKGFRPIFAGVDLNSARLFPTIFAGGLGDEHRQDAVRAADGLSALEHVRADRHSL
jgi:hypothetical protein